MPIAQGEQTDYREQAVAAARHLVTEGFLLEPEVERGVDEALALFDEVRMGHPSPGPAEPQT